MLRKDYGTYRNITSAATTTVKTGPGILSHIVVNKAVAASTYTIYDSLTGTGTKIGTVTNAATLTSSQFTLPFCCQFTTGLTIVTSSTDDITVVYE